MKHITNDIVKINKDLERSKKLLIAIGDSFTFGSSSWDEELINLYPPEYINQTITYDHYSLDIKKRICNLYPESVFLDESDRLNFTLMFQNNSYVNVLGNLLKNKYTVANLGVPARGNLSAISNLFMVNINWDLADEIILIYMPSSMNRIDVINDGFIPSKYSSLESLFQTAWPTPPNGRNFRSSNKIIRDRHGSDDSPWNRLQDSLYDSIYSEKFDVLKTILEFQQLNTWVKLHKANLIVIPAFSDYYNPNYFSSRIKLGIQRNYPSRELVDILNNDYTSVEHYVDYVPWYKIYHPHNYHSFYHYSLGQVMENSNDVNMLSLIGSPSKDNWIMSCGHPSAKSHKLMADYIFSLLKKPII